MINMCDQCGSTHIIKKGTRQTGEGLKYRYKCRDCGKAFSVLEAEQEKHVSVKKRLIFTSAITGCAANREFLGALENYAKENDAHLIIMPIRYINPTNREEDTEYSMDECDPILTPYLLEDAYVDVDRRFRALCDLKIQATTSNPLSGMEPLARGFNTVIGHPQLQMQTITQRDNTTPVFLTTTGAITEAVFSATKAGYKANFHHSLSAVVVEFTQDQTFMRHLSFDGEGFYDLEFYYTAESITPTERIEALIVGDEHVMFACDKTKAATYLRQDSIVNTLLPKVIVRHDVLDCYTVSHHHANNFMQRMSKHLNGENDIQVELDLTLRHIEDTTPTDTKTVIVASNHNEHLSRWLNESDPKRDLVNAKVYHMLMYKMINHLEETGSIGDPFKMYAEFNNFFIATDVKFLGRNESFRICDIELADHGDAGFNGSRGSRKQYANLSTKSVIGHSHSPGIDKGCYQVGTSSTLRMEYNKGPSNWSNTHCVIYPNGKRQLISVIHGEWRG